MRITPVSLNMKLVNLPYLLSKKQLQITSNKLVRLQNKLLGITTGYNKMAFRRFRQILAFVLELYADCLT